MNKFLLASLLASFSLASNADELKGRALPLQAAKTQPARVASMAGGPQLVAARIVPSTETDASWILQYGERVDVFSEDFSKMEKGSLGNPATSVEITMANPEYPWTNLDPKYTDQPGWGAGGAYPAGGMVSLFDEEDLDDYAHINTPMLDLHENDGVAVLEFKARTYKKNNTSLIIEAAETYNMSPTWKILEQNYSDFEVTPEWKTYQFYFRGCESYTLFNIVPQESPAIYIDDLKVFQIKAHVGFPQVLPHSDYTSESFTANWSAVPGADHYLLSVKKFNEEMEDWEEFIDEAQVDGTSFVVPEIESGATYAYTVYAVKGEYTSLPSDEVIVFDLAAPVMGDTKLTDDGYHAQWSAVPSAERYNYWAMNERVAKQDGTFKVTKMDFDEVKLPDGSEPYMQLGDEPNCYGDTYIFGEDQAGWHVTNYMPYVGGFIALDAYFYIYQSDQSGMISPALDFSKDNGRIDLSMRLMGELVNWWDEAGTKHQDVVQCAVALFNYDEVEGDYSQAELVYPGTVGEDWGTFTAKLTKGTKNSKVGIFAVTMPGNLYVDDLLITQQYNAGDVLREPFYFGRYLEGTEVDVTIPERVRFQHLYHKVSAIKSDSYFTYDDICESRFSDECLVEAAETGISTPTTRKPFVMFSNGNLDIQNPAGEKVEVYTVDGRLIASDATANEHLTMPVAMGGTYVVRIGKQSIKVQL